MLITFHSANGAKWYAATPTGELAWSDQQGLYEWRDSQRIAYTGADRQGSDRNGSWVLYGRPEPHTRGFIYATWAYAHNVN